MRELGGRGGAWAHRKLLNIAYSGGHGHRGTERLGAREGARDNSSTVRHEGGHVDDSSRTSGESGDGKGCGATGGQTCEHEQ